MIKRFFLTACYCLMALINATAGNGSPLAPAGVFDARLLDVNARIFKDNFPADTCYQPFHTPRKYTLSFQVALRSPATQQFSVSVVDLEHSSGAAFPGTARFRHILPVHLEGNTQGSGINVPNGPVPASWVPYLVRLAPFDIMEALQEMPAGTLQVTANETAGILVQLDVPATCTAGLYEGKVRLQDASAGVQDVPFSFRVYATNMPAFHLDYVNWLSEIPENLKTGTPVASWSEAHWDLLRRAGQLMIEDGQNMMYTPLVNNRHPLIQTWWDPATAKLSFNYSRFDRWVHMFDSLGFERFAGRHVRFQGLGSTQVLFIKNAATGDTISLTATQLSLECFQETFFADLDKHLDTLGLKGRYVQHVFDEPPPANIEEYRRYNELVKKYMHNVKTIDAINSQPQLFSPLVDLQVFSLPGLVLQKNSTVPERLADNREVWLYHTASPFPPYPNRQLDRPLVECRLWPWLAFRYNANGFLWWAANEYRGVPDEYATSLGALPDGTQHHDPGGAWYYYRSADGLLSSMRLLNFREGMADVTLLARLKTINPAKVQEMMDALIQPGIEVGMARPFSDYKSRAEAISKGYETDPKKYYDNRRQTLELLEAGGL
ncbi:glycoside hydrolase domain-containing protein [Chitinophaga alhagiae]|uniref:glycoside hydrolase domain-containing protein n=1 Tax=Chitinophaga alhagiae TaxID=2203219 RepID=UPI001300582A|nr:glycoside hydrolase domain-containing protein [Chitinophaga alhagiae]